MAAERDITGSQSVDRALQVLSLVGRGPEQGLSLLEIVERSGFNKATTRRLLLALMRARMVSQDEVERRYFLGEEAYVLGVFAAPRFGLLEMAMESLTRLARQTSDACFLSIRRDTFSICLHREEGNYPIRSHALQKGFEHPLGVGAGSLAMLSTLPDGEVEDVLARNADYLAATFPMVTAADIRAAVQVTRRRGYALNPGVPFPNSWGLGVALRYPDGRLAGALSVAAIDSRMQEPRQSELSRLLREEAACVEAKLERAFDRDPPKGRAGHRANGHPTPRLNQPRRISL